jgi:hypothetical protein
VIGPLGYLFAACAVILALALYRTQNRAARREQALESQIKALKGALESAKSRPERLTFPLSGSRDRYERFSKNLKR